jgi:thiamine biosynthesis lipoprotein
MRNFNKLVFIILIFAASMFMMSCASKPQTGELKRYEFGAPCMGTWWKFVLYATNEAQAKSAAEEAFKKIKELDDKFTDYYAESELMQLCYKSGDGEVKVSDELYDIIEKALKISKLTDGAFDITAGPVIQLWRWSGRHRQFPPREKMEKALSLVDYQNVKINPRKKTITLLKEGMRLDLGGIAKGYAADKCLQIFRRHGITSALVAGSGDIAVGNPPPGKKGWRIDVGSGENQTNTLGIVLELKNCGISTSGDVEQFIEINGVRYSHILDPKTGLGLTNRIQATVIAENATLSDALATSACILGKEKGLKLIENKTKAAVLFITREGTNAVITKSSRFPDFR